MAQGERVNRQLAAYEGEDVAFVQRLLRLFMDCAVTARTLVRNL